MRVVSEYLFRHVKMGLGVAIGGFMLAIGASVTPLAGKGLDSLVVASDTISRVTLPTVIISAPQVHLSPGGLFLQRSALSAAPGSAGEPVRAAARLMSAQSISDLQAFPSIAGDDGDRTLTLLDGIPIRMPYRFVGAFSVFNPLMTGDLQISPHGYSVDYGDAFSSLIAVTPRRDVPTRTEADLQLAFPFSMAALAIPVDQESRTAVRVGGRVGTMRQFQHFIPDEVKDRVREFFPEISDASIFVTSSPGPVTELGLTGLYSSEQGNAFNSNFTFTYRWTKVFTSASARQRLGNMQLHAAVGFQDDDLWINSELPGAEVSSPELVDMFGRYISTYGIADATMSLVKDLDVRGGLTGNWLYNRSSFDGSFDWLNGRSPATSSEANIAMFVNTTIRLREDLRFESGLRLSRFRSIQADGLEWRSNVEWLPTASSRLIVTYGNYLMAASDARIVEAMVSAAVIPGNIPRVFLPSVLKIQLVPEQSNAASVAYSQSILISPVAELAIETEGYYKRGSNVMIPERFPAVFATKDSGSFQPSQNFTSRNVGGGYTATLAFHPIGLALAQTMYWQRSEIFDPRGVGYSTGADIPRSLRTRIELHSDGWFAGLTWQRHSGGPFTAARFTLINDGRGGEDGEFLWDAANGARLPDYNRIDAMVSREFRLFGAMLTPYIEIINLGNDENSSGVQYYYLNEGPQKIPASSYVHNTFPFFPTVGITFHYQL